ncbi:MAG: hypothetical protein CMJ75_03865 [Planctomycetaceae bacterium]|nr:hypothetical protein [Planctomycetaceae bacterium]
MQLALLGSDADTLAIARAVNRSPAHALIGVYQPPAQLAELRALLPPGGEWTDDWESLLHDDRIDAVIVGASDADAPRDDQLRKLVQSAKPLLVTHPACEAIIAFELDMIRQDTRSVLIPYRPWRWHPALMRLVESVAMGQAPAIGRLEQVTLDREMEDRHPRSVLNQLVRDAGVLHPLLGRIERVSAMGGDHGRQLTNLTVTLSGQDGRIARWTVHPAPAGSRARLTVIGTAGSCGLEMPQELQRWKSIDGVDDAERWDHWDPALAAITALERAIETDVDDPSWLEATRELEVVDGVEQSLRRGRTIELLDQRPQEEGTFKGVMAVGGCGLLLLTLMILIVGSVVEGLQLPRHRRAPDAAQNFAEEAAAETTTAESGYPLWLRLWPVYPFGLFLLLQLLRLVYPAAGGTPQGRRGTPNQAGG